MRWAWSLFVVASIVIVAMVIWNNHARSQVRQPAPGPVPFCASIEEIEHKLGTEYGETRFATGTMGLRNHSMITYRNPRTGSWTIVAVRIDGHACVLAAGGGFETGEEL